MHIHRLRGLALLLDALVVPVALAALVWALVAGFQALRAEIEDPLRRAADEARTLAQEAAALGDAAAAAAADIGDATGEAVAQARDLGRVIDAISLPPLVANVPVIDLPCTPTARAGKLSWSDPVPVTVDIDDCFPRRNILAGVNEKIAGAVRTAMAPVAEPISAVGDSLGRIGGAVQALGPLAAALQARAAALEVHARALAARRDEVAARFAAMAQAAGWALAAMALWMVARFALRFVDRLIRGARMLATGAP